MKTKISSQRTQPLFQRVWGIAMLKKEKKDYMEVPLKEQIPLLTTFF